MAGDPGDAHADEIHFPVTADGWRLALHRHVPRGSGPRTPVILCPGYACNRRFIDYDDRYSLARHLARAGFDAWALDLRGRGLARPTPAARAAWTWTFDDLAAYDVPAAVDHVTTVTGKAVAWVGHSMGGMLLYAYLGRRPDAPVVAGVTVASPVVFPPTRSTLLARLGELLLDAPIGETIHQRLVMGALWAVLSRSSVIEVGMNPDNIDRRIVGRALPRSISNVSRAKLAQFARWSREGEFCSADRRIDYRAALAGVRTPLLVMAGSGDRIAPPETVHGAFDFLPHGRAGYREFGRAHGHAADYGHVDLILGRAAPDEVFPAVSRWLAEAA